MVIDGVDNLLQGNYVGVDATGTTPLGNRLNGIDISGPTNRLVGNVVSGNGQEGVQIANATAVANVLEGNLIGTDATGTVAVGNGSGYRGIVVWLRRVRQQNRRVLGSRSEHRLRQRHRYLDRHRELTGQSR